MKRVTKFQEGGSVEMTAAERRRQNIQRLNERRAANRTGAEARAEIERFNERMRQGTLTPEEMRRMGGRSDVERFSERAQRGQLTAEEMRRMGGQPTATPDFSVNQQGEARRMSPSRELVPSGGREVGMPRGENLPAVRREGMAAERASPSAPSMRSENLPAAQSPRNMMRQALPSAGAGGMRPRVVGGAGPTAAAGLALGLGSEALRYGMDAYRNRRPSGPYEQGMEPEGTPEAAAAETERQRPMPAPATATPPSASQRRAAPRPAARESMTADDLNEIVLRLTRGEKPVTETEKRIADRMGIAYRKGGMVKAKTAMKKGGAVKPKTAMKKGGAVKPKAPATKMKAGGKVAPKKMMKGGMTSKPKKMMGGGRAMYAKGGMAKGCK